MARVVSFVVLLAIAAIIAVLVFKVMADFLLPMFLAAVLVVTFRPLHLWFVARCRGHDRIAAGLTTTAILLIVLVPLFWVLTRGAIEGLSIARRMDPDEMLQKVTRLRDRLNLTLPSDKAQRLLDAIESGIDDLDALSADPPAMEQKVAVLANQLAELEKSLSASGQAAGTAKPSPPVEPGKGASPAVSEAVKATLGRVSGRLGLLTRLSRDAEAENGREVSKSETDAGIRETIARLRSDQEELRLELLGSPGMHWLRLQANPSKEQLEGVRTEIQQWLAPLALGTTQFLGNFVLGLVVMIVSLYFFLADGPSMIRTIRRLSPLDDRHQEELLREFDTISRAMVVAMLATAVVQALLAGLGYYLAGLESVFLLMVLTAVFSLVPFFGAFAVWAPCCLYLFFLEDRVWAAVLLAIYGACVISMIDNVVKPMILHGRSNLHPLLALLSVLGGVKALGPIGIFVGPMVVAFLYALLNMLQAELTTLGEKSGER
ncbi:MAG: AI-2E family transporter [Pirellulales bacterium]